MSVEDTIERVWGEFFSGARTEMDGLDMTRGGVRALLSSLRPGDKLPNGLVAVENNPVKWNPGEAFSVADTVMKLWQNRFQYATAGDAKRLIDEIDRLSAAANEETAAE